ncbi:MAG: FecR domain-containing protein [Aridibacter sp.]
MSNQKYRKFYIEWWKIKKSTVYRGTAILVLLTILIGGGWWLWTSDWLNSQLSDGNAPKDAAQIVSFEGDIRIIRLSTRATERVTEAAYVSAGDTIQTQSDGRAQIKMIDGSILSIRPNSTVVIRDSSSLLGGTSVRVKLDDGQIRVRTEDQPESSNNVVEVKESESRLLSQTEASFNINQTTDNGEIRINRGGVESNIGGQKKVLKQDEYVSFSNNQINTREKLLKSPNLREPSSSAQILSSGGNADVSFSWERSAGNSFHLQIAKSPFFVKDGIVIERESLKSLNFTLANITPGTYFWRVKASAESGQVSDWSEPAKFTVIKNQQGAKIAAADWNVENVGGKVYIISGNTKPGATVRVLGRETFASADGTFHIQISSPSVSVPVEIYDDKGNKSRFIISLKSGKIVG